MDALKIEEELRDVTKRLANVPLSEESLLELCLCIYDLGYRSGQKEAERQFLLQAGSRLIYHQNRKDS